MWVRSPTRALFPKQFAECQRQRTRHPNSGGVSDDSPYATQSLRAPPDIGAAAPLFIVRHVPTSLAFYRDRLGFDVTFQGPEPDDIFFGIVQRGRAMLMLKAIDVEPAPNHTRDIGHGIARWDAYVYVPDPDALAEEFASRGVEFFLPLQDNTDGLRGFEIQDADGYVLYFGRPITHDSNLPESSPGRST